MADAAEDGGQRPVVFISYRRVDTEHYAAALVEALKAALGSDYRRLVFFDLDSIQPGDPFPTEIAWAASSCRVMVALIGPRWGASWTRREVTGPGTEVARREGMDTDWVLIEITSALERRGCRVVPLLCAGARIPAPRSLPHPLKPLVNRSALSMAAPTSKDARKAAEAIRRWVRDEVTPEPSRWRPPIPIPPRPWWVDALKATPSTLYLFLLATMLVVVNRPVAGHPRWSEPLDGVRVDGSWTDATSAAAILVWLGVVMLSLTGDKSRGVIVGAAIHLAATSTALLLAGWVGSGTGASALARVVTVALALSLVGAVVAIDGAGNWPRHLPSVRALLLVLVGLLIILAGCLNVPLVTVGGVSSTVQDLLAATESGILPVVVVLLGGAVSAIWAYRPPVEASGSTLLDVPAWTWVGLTAFAAVSTRVAGTDGGPSPLGWPFVLVVGLGLVCYGAGLLLVRHVAPTRMALPGQSYVEGGTPPEPD